MMTKVTSHLAELLRKITAAGRRKYIRGVYPPHRPWCIPPRWPDGFPQFLIIMNLILGPAIVSSLLLYLLLYFFVYRISVRSAMPYLQ